jgi:Flp pilus assembly pilin Flp
MLAIYLHVQTVVLTVLQGHRLGRRLRHDEAGQTSAEYALVLLGAAAIALLIVAWATKTDLIGKLFDAVLDAITGKVK